MESRIRRRRDDDLRTEHAKPRNLVTQGRAKLAGVERTARGYPTVRLPQLVGRAARHPEHDRGTEARQRADLPVWVARVRRRDNHSAVAPGRSVTADAGQHGAPGESEVEHCKRWESVNGY